MGKDNLFFMEKAIEQAESAYKEEEVPGGCVCGAIYAVPMNGIEHAIMTI